MEMKVLQEIQDVARSLGCTVKEDEGMHLHTSFKTGGKAKLFIEPNVVQSLAQLMASCAEKKVKPLILGNGTNLLISDQGIDGVVIHIGDAFKQMEYCGNGLIKCDAGVTLAQLCIFAMSNHLKGLEFAYGIPGTVGGAAFMNAGAYGGEMKDVIVSCSHIDTTGKKGSLAGDDLDFGYRKSAYTRNEYIITGVTFQLEEDGVEAIRFNMESTMNRRKEKQPLEYPSAGSVFKRPEGHFAGALIEQCGLKGKTIGGAQVSEKHAGFIINIGQATTKDITDLIALVKETVKRQTGVQLEEEIKIIG